MSLLVLFASGWWPFTITIVSLVGPFLFKQLRAARRQDGIDEEQPSRRAARPLLSMLLLTNAIYILYYLLLHPPTNVFSALRIPLTTPAPTIRALLLQHSDPPKDTLPQHLEILLSKLGSFEVRTLYMR